MTKQAGKTDNMAAIRLALNLIFAVIVGVGAWFGAPALITWLLANVPAVSGLALSALVLRLVVAVVLFILGTMLTALLVTAVLPRNAKESNEREIAKQQAAMMAKKRAKEGRSGSRKRRKR